jgi:hypothetical protein
VLHLGETRKEVTMKRALIISALAFLSLPTIILAITNNPLVNGGFEDPRVPLGEPYVHLGKSQYYVERPPLPGWDSYSYYTGVVLFNCLLYEPDNPVTRESQAVQIEVPGDWISQDFPTVQGQNYTLSFDMWAYFYYGGPGRGYHPCPCESILEVTVGPVSATFEGSSTVYTRHTLNFTAVAPVTTLKFQNPSYPAAWGNYPQIDNVVITIAPPYITGLDIKPGSFPNSINRKSKGKIPVAILSTSEFNAPEELDQSTLTFGYTGDEQSLAFCNLGSEDVNGDGFGDLICHFYTELTGFRCGDIEGVLKGRTIQGMPIESRDSIHIVPCR